MNYNIQSSDLPQWNGTFYHNGLAGQQAGHSNAFADRAMNRAALESRLGETERIMAATGHGYPNEPGQPNGQWISRSPPLGSAPPIAVTPLGSRPLPPSAASWSTLYSPPAPSTPAFLPQPPAPSLSSVARQTYLPSLPSLPRARPERISKSRTFCAAQMPPIEAPTGGMAVPGMNCGDSGNQRGIGGRFIADEEGSEDDEYGEGDYSSDDDDSVENDDGVSGNKPTPKVGSLRWWAKVHGEDGGFAILKIFFDLAHGLLVQTGFPSFRKVSGVNIEQLLFKARMQYIRENNPEVDPPKIKPEDVRRLVTTHIGRARFRDFALIKPVFVGKYGFIEGGWEELNELQRLHNLELKFSLVDSYEYGIVNKVSEGQVIAFFSSEGYLEALRLMLSVASLIESDDGLMPHSYFAYVGQHLVRGAVGFADPMQAQPRFIKSVYGPVFDMLLAAARKHLVGLYCDAYRRYLYTVSRKTRPADAGAYVLPSSLAF